MNDSTDGEPSSPRVAVERGPDVKRVPRRILHFSNGTVEEYSTDEEDNTAAACETLVDPQTLTWGPWLLNRGKTFCKHTLSVIDYCGERIAWSLGITSPKYQYAIDEYYRVQAEEEEIRKEVEEYNRSIQSASQSSVVYEPASIGKRVLVDAGDSLSQDNFNIERLTPSAESPTDASTPFKPVPSQTPPADDAVSVTRVEATLASGDSATVDGDDEVPFVDDDDVGELHQDNQAFTP